MTLNARSRPNALIFPVAILIFAMAIGGCAKPPSKPLASTAPPVPPTQVELSDGDSTIVGRVTDDELVPIEGAMVRVVPQADFETSPLKLSSDATGTFRALGLQPGTYNVMVSAGGYEETEPRRVTTAAGQETTVNFTLEPVAAVVAHVKTDSFKFREAAAFCIKAAELTPCASWRDTTVRSSDVPQGPSRKAFAVDEFVEGRLDTIIVEATWTHAVGACNGRLRTDVYAPQQPSPLPTGWADGGDRGDQNPYHWDNVPEALNPPTRVFIPREGTPQAMLSPERMELNKGQAIATSGQWNITINAYPAWDASASTEVSCHAQTVATVYYSLFYLAPAKDDWSALP